MNVLLLSMPDSFEHMAPVAVRIPNGALASLAGNLDPHHRVAIADLILVQGQVGATIARLVGELQPDVVGLSVMTFQRDTALRVARLVRQLRPGVRVVAGGYDPSLATEPYEACLDIDCVVRGEGETTFRDLLRAWEGHGDLAAIPGLVWRDGGGVSVANAMSARPLAPNEIIAGVQIVPVKSAAYAKLHQRASHFAIVGVAAAVDVKDGVIQSARIGVTGAAAHATRLTDVERALAGKAASAATVEAAARNAGAGLQNVNADIHASEEYRRAMVAVFTERALKGALARV
jgi:hypothetical protein